LRAFEPTLAIILGSGLGSLVEDVRDAIRIPYADIPGFGDVQVQGHAGQLVVGQIANVPVAVFAGRFHLYEGHSASAAGFPVRLAHALGIRTLMVSNAAGGINTTFAPGDLMMIEDQINLMCQSPLVGPVDAGDTRFPDMSDPYDASLRATLRHVATTLGIPLQAGIYAGVLGPAYETRAEIRMLRTLGADALAMSIIPEVLTARALGMRVAGVSCIANMATGLRDAPLTHEEVLRATSQMATQFRTLVRGFMAAL
jgi:purine-nucleoside phosphorylase